MESPALEKNNKPNFKELGNHSQHNKKPIATKNNTCATKPPTSQNFKQTQASANIMSLFNAYLLKLLPGAIAITLIAGFGYHLGLKHKQNEVDALQNQLTEYRHLGENIDSIKDAINEDMKHKNEALVDAYNKEIKAIQADFKNTRNNLAQATEDLKKRGTTLNDTASLLAKAIRESPPGEERNNSIEEFISLFIDPVRRQEICATTPVEENQMKELKRSFNIGAK